MTSIAGVISGFGSDILSIACTPDGSKLVVGEKDGVASIIDFAQGGKINKINGVNGVCQHVIANNEVACIVTSTGDSNGYAYLFNFVKKTNQMIPVKMADFEYGVFQGEIVLDSNEVVVYFAGLSGVTSVEISSGRQKTARIDDGISGIAISSIATAIAGYVYAASNSGSVYSVDISSQSAYEILSFPGTYFCGLDISHDNSKLVTNDTGNSLLVQFDIKSKSVFDVIDLGQSGVISPFQVLYSMDGYKCYVGDLLGSPCIVDLATENVFRIGDIKSSPSIALSKNGENLYVGSGELGGGERSVYIVQVS